MIVYEIYKFIEKIMIPDVLTPMQWKVTPTLTNPEAFLLAPKCPTTESGWVTYKDLGPYTCDEIYPLKDGYLRPVSLGPVTSRTLERSRAEVTTASPTGFNYSLDVALTRESLGDQPFAQIDGMQIPVVYFDDFIYDEYNFQEEMPFHKGEPWRFIRFGCKSGPRLDVPYFHFNPSEVEVEYQIHHLNEGVPLAQKPQIKGYGPVVGKAEQFKVKFRNTDVIGHIFVNAHFQGIGIK